MYKVLLTKRAQKDIPKLKSANLCDNAKTLIAVISEDPYRTPPPYEKLVGDLAGFYSRRINITHRLVYEVDEIDKYVKVLRMWSHYE
jgi:Txe/YoeB family toxin of toxin-antitoxin system